LSTRLGVAAALVGTVLLPGDVAVSDGRVDAVGLPGAGGRGLAAPGLVDVQVNGYAGTDVVAADDARFAELRRALAADGVTAFGPTVITGDPAAVTAAVARIGAAVDGPGARVLGVHLEGPWISDRRLGTHPAHWRRDPEHADVDRLLACGPVRFVTLAPELPGALDLVGSLTARGVTVLLGHSAATAEQAHAAFDRGAAGATHLFNAMPPLHHRDPGLVGAALTRPGTTVSIIADGHHLAPDVLRLVFAAARGRVVLVSDATAASGMPDGAYVLGDVAVTLTDGAVRNAAGGLAGSAATLLGCVRQAVGVGIDLGVALHAASTVPADLAGRPDLGRLRPGLPADVLILDDDLTVRDVLIAGRSAT
jgi:N-acetylglucosamine-6-phosphate deacetylase